MIIGATMILTSGSICGVNTSDGPESIVSFEGVGIFLWIDTSDGPESIVSFGGVGISFFVCISVTSHRLLPGRSIRAYIYR